MLVKADSGDPKTASPSKHESGFSLLVFPMEAEAVALPVDEVAHRESGPPVLFFRHGPYLIAPP